MRHFETSPTGAFSRSAPGSCRSRPSPCTSCGTAALTAPCEAGGRVVRAVGRRSMVRAADRGLPARRVCLSILRRFAVRTREDILDVWVGLRSSHEASWPPGPDCGGRRNLYSGHDQYRGWFQSSCSWAWHARARALPQVVTHDPIDSKRRQSAKYNGYKRRKGIKVHAASSSDSLPFSMCSQSR